MPGTLDTAADSASVAKPTRLIVEDPSLTSSSSDDSLALTTSGTSTSSAPSSSGKPNFKEPDSKFTEPGTGKDKAGPGDSDGPGSTDPGKGSGQGKTKGGDVDASIYITYGKEGVFFEDPNTADGILNNGESLLTVENGGLTASGGGFYTVSGVDMAADNVTVRFNYVRRNEGGVITPLNLSGFGTGDKVVLDSRTYADEYFGVANNLWLDWTNKVSSVNNSVNRGYAGVRAALPSVASPADYYAIARILKPQYSTSIRVEYTRYSKATGYAGTGGLSVLAKGLLAWDLANPAPAPYTIEIITPI